MTLNTYKFVFSLISIPCLAGSGVQVYVSVPEGEMPPAWSKRLSL